jgi:U32 family peptidase
MKKDSNNVELMAPAGGYDSLSAAIRAGADSVYFGIEKLNMRSRSSANFAIADLKKIAKKCHRCSVKPYLALNTLIYDNDLPAMREICDAAKLANISAIIASDIATISYAHSIAMPVHISVQTNVSNIEAVRFFAKFADVIVLARELDIKQIKAIADTIKKEKITGPSGELIRIELFAHGALCVSVSGKCYMSLATYNTSGNRGACYQNCRRKYRVIDEESGQELVIDNQYVMSPKDICTIRVLDKLISSGVTIFKIEGRGRSADYVGTVTKTYRKAIDTCLDKTYASAAFAEWEQELETVFNRGFWHGGYYLGEKTGEWSNFSGNRATVKKFHIGYVSNYFQKIGVAEITLNAGVLKEGDEILLTGNTTGAYKTNVAGIRLDEKTVKQAEKGDIISLKLDTKVRRNDKVYLLESTR